MRYHVGRQVREEIERLKERNTGQWGQMSVAQRGDDLIEPGSLRQKLEPLVAVAECVDADPQHVGHAHAGEQSPDFRCDGWTRTKNESAEDEKDSTVDPRHGVTLADDEDQCGHRHEGQCQAGSIIVQLVHAPQFGRPTPTGQVENTIQDDSCLCRSVTQGAILNSTLRQDGSTARYGWGPGMVPSRMS